jgi:3-oxoacyl-[acyl-carrier-protein] synthase II
MAEGAGALVLESLQAAQSRGAKILGVIAGCGELADTFHRTRPKPDGKPIADCIRNALTDASMTFEQIDYINAHGTSTSENDKMEYLGTAAVFGDHARKIPVSSNKSMIGHTLSAAGIIEAVFTLLTLEHQRIPPRSITIFRIPQSRSTSYRTRQETRASLRECRIRSASADRMSRSS